jgi:hypothetical protein
MKAYNYAQSQTCVICNKRIGLATDHAACSKKKQQLHRESETDLKKVLAEYPRFFIRAKP